MWAYQVRVALGTGSYMMAYVMFFVALTFINREGMDDIITLYHVLLTAPFGVLVRPARGEARIGGCGLADRTTRLFPLDAPFRARCWVRATRCR